MIRLEYQCTQQGYRLLTLFRGERLSASDMLHICKVIEHVYKNWLNPGSDSSGSQSSAAAQDPVKSELDPDDLAAAALEKFEVYCNDQASSSIFLFDIQVILPADINSLFVDIFFCEGVIPSCISMTLIAQTMNKFVTS